MSPKPFHPPRRILMGPGPSDVSPRVLAAMARPTLGHLDPAFIGLMDEVKDLLRFAFRTENAFTMPVSGPGSIGMESCFVNLVEPGDTVVVCRNGVFGGRMVENVRRCGATAIIVDDEWGAAVDLEKVEAALAGHPEASLLAFVHAETSTGALSDAEALTEMAHRHGCLVIADTVTSLGGSPLFVDQWEIDAAYSGSQKCLSCTPGLSPVTFNQAALDRIRNRSQPVQSWFMDATLIMGYWGESGRRAYHHTAPVNAIYALHEALLILREEGLERAWERHEAHHLALRAGLEAMGLELAVAPEARLPQLNVVRVPNGIDEAAVRGRLLEDFTLEIGAGLGDLAGKVWRIGLMGHACRMTNVIHCLTAFESVLSALGAAIHRGVAVDAARRTIAG